MLFSLITFFFWYKEKETSSEKVWKSGDTFRIHFYPKGLMEGRRHITKMFTNVTAVSTKLYVQNYKTGDEPPLQERKKKRSATRYSPFFVHNVWTLWWTETTQLVQHTHQVWSSLSQTRLEKRGKERSCILFSHVFINHTPARQVPSDWKGKREVSD